MDAFGLRDRVVDEYAAFTRSFPSRYWRIDAAGTSNVAAATLPYDCLRLTCLDTILLCVNKPYNAAAPISWYWVESFKTDRGLRSKINSNAAPKSCERPSTPRSYPLRSGGPVLDAGATGRHGLGSPVNNDKMSAPAREHAKLWASWRRDIDALRDDIYDLHHHATMWRELATRVDATGAMDRGFFLDAYTRMYVAHSGSAIRRIAESQDTRVLSLGRLITAIAANPQVITKERYLTSWGIDDKPCPDVVRANAEAAWEVHAGGALAFDVITAKQDLYELGRTTEAVVTMVDKTIAHRDKLPPDNIPTFGDLAGAIESITMLYKRYQLLLLGRSQITMDPVMQGDWLTPFRQPLA